jgi:hypothetical protein
MGAGVMAIHAEGGRGGDAGRNCMLEWEGLA